MTNIFTGLLYPWTFSVSIVCSPSSKKITLIPFSFAFFKAFFNEFTPGFTRNAPSGHDDANEDEDVFVSPVDGGGDCTKK